MVRYLAGLSHVIKLIANRKYEQSNVFGTICSATSNAVWLPDRKENSAGTTGAGRALVGAVEDVLCWDIKKGDLISRWHANDCNYEVTVIACCDAVSELFAVGYE